MNIAHITPDFNYACGRSYYVFLLLKYLKKEGHNVILVTNGGDSLDRVEDENIQVHIIKTLAVKNPVAYVSSAIKLAKVFKENQIDIVHTHHRFAELAALHSIKPLTFKPKTVFTSLSLVHKKYRVEFKSDRIIAVSSVIKNMLVNKFKLEESRIELIHNFIDTEELSRNGYKPGHSGNKNFYNILSVGRFHPDKNFELLFKALKILNDKDILLTLVGEGENLMVYKKLSEDYDIKTEFHPPAKELQEFYHKADLCVLPSSIDPFPGFMLQSGLHKKPFIGTKADGIKELIKDNYNGALFESENKIQLAQKIKYFKDNPEEAVKYGLNLHKDVMNNYTQEKIIPEIERVYSDLLVSS